MDLGIIEQVKELKNRYGSVELEFIHKLGMDGSKQHPGGHHVLWIIEFWVESHDSTYSNVPNKRACTFISGKVCPLTLIEPKRQTLSDINVHARLFGTLE